MFPELAEASSAASIAGAGMAPLAAIGGLAVRTTGPNLTESVALETSRRELHRLHSANRVRRRTSLAANFRTSSPAGAAKNAPEAPKGLPTGLRRESPNRERHSRALRRP